MTKWAQGLDQVKDLHRTQLKIHSMTKWAQGCGMRKKNN